MHPITHTGHEKNVIEISSIITTTSLNQLLTETWAKKDINNCISTCGRGNVNKKGKGKERISRTLSV